LPKKIEGIIMSKSQIVNKVNHSKKRMHTIIFSVALIAIVLLGYLAGSAMFSQSNTADTSPSVQASGVQLGPSGYFGQGCCGGVSYDASVDPVANIVDPPAGEAFKDPSLIEDTNPDPSVVEVNVEAKVAPITINGVTANLMTYNGQYPGPTILYKQGNILKLHFKNSLPSSGTNILGYSEGVSNIHTHGLHVSPTAPSDDPTIQVEPGQTYDYYYNTSLQPGGVFNFYHGHIHGLTAEQFWGGLTGSLISEDPTDLLADYETHILFIKDIALNGDEAAPYVSVMDYVMGKEGNIVTVNGMVNPVLNIQPGEVQRWRIINACNARYLRIGFENHNLQLIGSDGGLLDKPYSIPEMLLSPSERADVLVKADQTAGTYKLLSLPYNNGCGGVAQTITLMTVNYSGATLNQNVPSTINPDAKRFDVETSMLPHRSLLLSMIGGRGYINGHDFDVSPLTITSEVGGYEIWDITSQCMMDHVFHIHINNFQVLSVSGGYMGYALYTQIPALKDSVYVPRGTTVQILVHVADYTGMTMFHCHIVEHEDIGMMGMWNIVPANETNTMH
jgi:FtsP/CotA-like multicopper oxidase with cupredoxin domain